MLNGIEIVGDKKNNESVDRISSVSVVKRKEMSGINEMMVDGEMRNLGIVKNFKDNKILNRHLPTNLAISWAHLDPGEKLDSHRHPVGSIIIAMEGSGVSYGDSEINFSEGDSLYIPPWNEHGFIGTGESGLWALSIQFSDVAIFENEIDPLTTFDLKDGLPPLKERQIKVIPRERLSQPFSFKYQTDFGSIFPENIDFSWCKIDSDRKTYTPPNDIVSLFIFCEGKTEIRNGSNEAINKGDAFWVEDALSLGVIDESPVRALIVNINNNAWS